MLERMLVKLGLTHNSRCVISHPKSGRTWLRVMLDELGIRCDYTHAGPEKKGDLHFNDLSTKLKHDYKRVLILTRDPRDVAVSNFHQKTKRSEESHQFHGEMAEFIRDPHLGLEKAAHFNLLWAAYAQDNERGMIVSYEAMQADTIGSMIRIARFFGADPSSGKVAEVVARNEFSRMQERERSGEFARKYGRPLMPRDTNDPSTFKVRRGQVGSYRDELSPEDVAYCDAKLAELDYFNRMAALTRENGDSTLSRSIA